VVVIEQESKDQTDSLFVLLFSVIFNNKEHSNDLRCLLGFIYSIFAVLSIDHTFYEYSPLIKKVKAII
jgi:hypothetical protein